MICRRNRGHQLRDCLGHLRRLEAPRGGYYASCLLTPRLRGPCLRHHVVHEFRKSVRRTDFGSIARELAGVIRFLGYKATHVDSIPSLRDRPAR